MIILSQIFMVAGALILLIAGLGIIRLPDFLTRIHPAAKTTTLGIMLFFIGAAFAQPDWTPRLIVAIILFLFTGPVSASALARTALTAEQKKEFYPKPSPEPEEEA